MRQIYIMEKGRFLVFRTLRNYLKILCFFFFIKKIPATESICVFLLYFFFALSISSVRFSKKVFLSDGRKIFPDCLIVQRLDCQSATLNIFHRLAQAVLAVPNLNQTSQAYGCAGMPASACLRRCFKNIKEKWIRLVYPIIIPCPASSGGIFSGTESGVVLSWFCKIVKTTPSFFRKVQYSRSDRKTDVFIRHLFCLLSKLQDNSLVLSVIKRPSLRFLLRRRRQMPVQCV